MFKKVYGQDPSELQKPSLTTSDERAPQISPSFAAPAPASVASPVSKPSPSAARNVLSSDVEIKGSVKFQNDLIVDGKIEGEIQSAGNLTIGENARIKAEIKTGSIIVYGKVHGNLTATDRIELKAGAEIIGDIKAKTLVMESGAIFVGKSTVGAPSQVVNSPAEAKSTPSSHPAQPVAAKQG